MALAYSGSIAAALLLGYLVYWGNSNKPLTDTGENTVAGLTPNQEQALFAARQLGDSGSTADDPILVARSDDASSMLQKSLDVSEDMLDDAARHPYFSEAEQQIQRVNELSHGDPEQDFGQGTMQ